MIRERTRPLPRILSERDRLVERCIEPRRVVRSVQALRPRQPRGGRSLLLRRGGQVGSQILRVHDERLVVRHQLLGARARVRRLRPGEEGRRGGG